MATAPSLLDYATAVTAAMQSRYGVNFLDTPITPDEVAAAEESDFTPDQAADLFARILNLSCLTPE